MVTCGEEHVALRHVGRGPKCDDEAEHERVPDDLVHRALGERWMRVFATLKMQPDLSQAEEIEVIDDERGDQDQRPAEERDAEQQSAQPWGFDVPDDRRHRPPLPVQQQQDEAREHMLTQ